MKWIKDLAIPIIVGLGSFFLAELYFHPRQLRTQIQAELYKETYSQRVSSYQAILELFPAAYWIEREASSEPLTDPRRRDLVQRVQREVTRIAPITTFEIYSLAFKALDFYIVNAGHLSTVSRKQWVADCFTPLVNAMRRDLHQDEIGKEISNMVFPDSAQTLPLDQGRTQRSN